jgi:CheY-like chemotaxis protein
MNNDNGVYVLLVEDDPQLRRSIERMLAAAGYDVHSVVDALEALAALGRCTFDVILSDHHLGGMDGVQLLELCRRSFPTMARVLATADHDFAIATRAVNDAAVGALVRKPVRPADLYKVLRSVAPVPPAITPPSVRAAAPPLSRNTIPQRFVIAGPTSEAPVVYADVLEGPDADLIRALNGSFFRASHSSRRGKEGSS